MQKVIEKFVVGAIVPQNKNVGWIKPDNDGNLTLYIYMVNKGGWVPVGGSSAEIIEVLHTPI